MSHVDEGTLHAYLDRALPSSERAALEAHLAQCTACRATLVEARALLERATVLLGSARPAEGPVPPFERLRRSRKPWPWRVRLPLAWAASLALALGLGYSLRGPGDDTPAAPPPETYVLTEDRPADPVREQKAAEPVRQNRRPAAAPAPSVVDQPARGAEAAHADSAAAVPLPAAAASGVIAIKPPEVQLRNAAPARAERDVALLEEARVRPAERSLAALRGRSVTTQWPIISRGTARSLLGADPVGVPGLAARDIRRSPAADGTIVVEQKLDSATVIQIFQRPALAAGFAHESVQPGAYERYQGGARRDSASAERLARFVGRLRVEIAGPLSQDSLNRLLEQVKPLP